jgi:hypothetical protein
VGTSRYDKYDGVNGGFRAPLNAAWTATSGPSGVTDLARILCVGLNSSGNIVKAASVAACSGILVVNAAAAAGDIMDVMTSGEIVDIGVDDIQGGVAATAGQKLYFDATAARLTATAPGVGVNGFYVGQVALAPDGTATRLVVRCQAVQL